MSEGIYRAVELILRLIVVLICAILIPLIQKKIQGDQTETAVKQAVYAAQQLLWSATGAERKEYATGIIKQSLEKLNITITDEQISNLIEAAVQELKIVKGEAQ